MKKMIITISDTFVRKNIEISIDDKNLEKLMSLYDDEMGLEFVIKEVK